MSKVKNTVITDFDNTLFNWFAVWHASFSSMLESIIEISGLDREILIADIRGVHQRHGTAEYAFLIEELECLRSRHPGKRLVDVYDDAIKAYRVARKQSLELYAGVRTTLQELNKRGVKIVVYTESLAYYSGDRFRRLELDPLVDYLFSPPDHELPQHFNPKTDRYYPETFYELDNAIHRELPVGTVKPNPEVLLDIIDEIGSDVDSTVYIGDNLGKDVHMAQQAGVADVWARYGKKDDAPGYDLLQSVSHWTEDMIAREQAIKPEHVNPTHIVDGFSELLDVFEFSAHRQ